MSYLEKLKNLNNDIQEEAIRHLDNAVLLACPGAGKTKTVVLKAAYLIKDVIKEPRGLACITFSNNAVKEFKDRFSELGVSIRSNIFFGTVHSFLLSEVVLPFGRILYPKKINDKTQIADSKQRSQCIREALEKNSINEVPDHWFFVIRNIRRLLHQDFDRTSKKKDVVISVSLDYEEILRKHNWIDFDDIIFLSLDILSNHDFVRKAISARFPWIIIDEYQDLGELPHLMFNVLLEKTDTKIFAVGDPHQSIHGFAGSDPKYLIELSKKEGVKCFDSVFNYRCCQPIIDASIDILNQSETKKYISKKEDPNQGNIYFQHCSQGAEEQIKLISDTIIPKILSRSTMPGDIAVLLRTRLDVFEFSSKLKQMGVPTHAHLEANYELTPLTIWVEDLAKWCAGGWETKSPSFDELFFFWYKYQDKIDKKCRKPEFLREKKLFYQKLDTLKKKDELLSDWIPKFVELFEFNKIFDSSESLNINTIREINSLKQLIYASTKTNFGNQRLYQFSGVDISKDKVIVMTLHASKGLQFDTIIMPMLEEGIIPSWDGKDIPEARRLFYVGITRAKNEVYLLWSGFNVNKWGRKFEKGPSRFVRELIEKDRCNSLKS